VAGGRCIELSWGSGTGRYHADELKDLRQDISSALATHHDETFEILMEIDFR
jgi:hypothetical protein